MKRALVALVLLWIPTLAFGQSVRVTSAYGPVEVHPAAGAAVIRVSASSLPLLDIGDEIRTGADASLTLELPDGSYMVVAENTTLRIERFWGSEIRNLARIMAGKVRFYIQRLGGRPNPYRVNTPTALIAVRGTTYEVAVDPQGDTEIRCFDGRVTVETAGLPDREVVLDGGRKTLVRSGQYPVPPVNLDEEFGGSRVVRVVRQDRDALAGDGSSPAPDSIAAGGDHRHRPVDLPSIPSLGRSGLGADVQRGKLSYPQE